MAKPASTTALSDVLPLTGEHTLSEVPLCGKINLRGNIADASFSQAIKSVLNIEAPNKANTVSSSADTQIFWLGPDEWLIHTPLDKTAEIIESLHSELADLHVALTDVSDYFCVIKLSGNHTRAVIASASPFDTRQANFPIGQCAQTRFGHASILLWPTDDAPTFQLQVRGSYAQYVYGYLGNSIKNIENFAAFRQNT